MAHYVLTQVHNTAENCTHVLATAACDPCRRGRVAVCVVPQAHGETGIDPTPQLQIVAMGTDGTCSRMRREALLPVLDVDHSTSCAVSTHRWQPHWDEGAFVDALQHPQPHTRVTRAIRLVRAQAATADLADAQPGSFALCAKQHANVAFKSWASTFFDTQSAEDVGMNSSMHGTESLRALICCSCGAHQRDGTRFPHRALPSATGDPPSATGDLIRKNIERARCVERARRVAKKKRQRADTRKRDTQPKQQARGKRICPAGAQKEGAQKAGARQMDLRVNGTWF